MICVGRLNVFPMTLKNIVMHLRRLYRGIGRHRFPLGLKADIKWCEHIAKLEILNLIVNVKALVQVGDLKRQWQHFDSSDL